MGVAFALRAWARVSADTEADAAADVVLAGLADRAGQPSGEDCTDVIGGDAGRLIVLARDTATAAVRTAAGAVAARLVAAAEDTADGPQWRMQPGYPILMPNFSHGTAGVAYALVLAGHALQRAELVAAGVAGATTLLAVGGRDGRWAAPMTIPRQSHRPEVAYGWCHGPAGTVRLFELLTRVQPDDPRWSRVVAQCYDAVLASGLPERRYPGFWDNLGRCCGTASVGTVFLDRYQATGDPAALAFVDRLATDVLARTLLTSEGATWSHTEHTATPPELPPEPGFMSGAAGIAGWLARVAAADRDRGRAAGTAAAANAGR